MEKLDEEKQRRSDQREKKKEKRYAKQVRGKCIIVAPCSVCGLVTNVFCTNGKLVSNVSRVTVAYIFSLSSVSFLMLYWIWVSIIG